MGMTLEKRRVLTKSSGCIPAPHVSQATYPHFLLKYFKNYSLNLHSGIFISVLKSLKNICLTSHIFYIQLYPQFFSGKTTKTKQCYQHKLIGSYILPACLLTPRFSCMCYHFSLLLLYDEGDPIMV